MWGTVLPKLSSIMTYFHASKGVVVLFAWLITQGKFVNILPFASNVCRTLYLVPLQLVISNETVVNSFHFSSAIIKPSNLLSVPHKFHRLLSRYQCYNHRIKQYLCTNTLGILCIARYKRSITAASYLRPQ